MSTAIPPFHHPQSIIPCCGQYSRVKAQQKANDSLSAKSGTYDSEPFLDATLGISIGINCLSRIERPSTDLF